MTQVAWGSRPKSFNAQQRHGLHKLTAELIRQSGYQPVSVPHPTRGGEHIFVAGGCEDSSVDVWVCPVCEDRGFVTYQREVHPCPARCASSQAQQAARQRKLYEGARLPAEYRDMTLESFRDLIRQRGNSAWHGKQFAYHATDAFINAGLHHLVNLREVYEAAGAKNSARDDSRNWLVLYGPHGTGKTGFAAAIVNAAVEAGEVVRYTRTQDFIAAVQARYGLGEDDRYPADGYGDVSAESVLEAVRNAPLLVLDEFDMPDAKRENKQAIIENVIRYRHGELLPTVITTNLGSMDEMEARWGTTTVSVIGQRAHWIGITGLPLRPVPQDVRLD